MNMKKRALWQALATLLVFSCAGYPVLAAERDEPVALESGSKEEQAQHLEDEDGQHADEHGSEDHAEEGGHDEAEGHSEEGGHDEEEGHVVLSDAQIEKADIEIVEAGPGTINPSITLFGVIRPDLDRLVHIVPRFPGIVTEVGRRLGSSVSKGDVLLSIESNESMRTYALRSPIAGRIVQRSVAPGQFADTDSPLMVVADLSTVWLDLQVHRHDASLVSEGQRVTFRPEAGASPVEAVVDYVSPIAAQDTQSVLARAIVPNPEGSLQPGLFVTASVEQKSETVQVVVARDAILYEGADSFVYVPGDEEGSFERLPVKIGRSDAGAVEIVEGLAPGSAYVSRNAFILKAEAGKSAASHAH